MADAGINDADAASDDEDDGADFLLKDDGVDIDLRLERYEWLLAQRPILLSSVMLRQNPHNVQACPLQLCSSQFEFVRLPCTV